MKSSGMSLSSGTRTRPARFTGFTLALVLLSTTCACTDRADHNVTARAGKAAVLPCTCPPNLADLVWQKAVAVGELDLVVDRYRGDGDDQAEEFRNRTELKLTENCSLTIFRVTTTDQGLYRCYYRTGPVRHDSIYLEVTADLEPQGPKELGSVQTTVVTSSVCVLLVIVIITVAAAVYVGIVRKNRRSMNGFAGGTLVRSV